MMTNEIKKRADKYISGFSFGLNDQEYELVRGAYIDGYKAALEQANADKAELVRQCSKIAQDYYSYNSRAWLEKYGDVGLLGAVQALLPNDQRSE